MPFSIEAEEALLGSCVMDGATVVPLVRHLLTAESFYREKHRWLWQILCQLDDTRAGIDTLTIADALGDKLEDVGGYSWLASLCSTVPTVVHAEHYAQIVRTHATRRTVLAEAEKLGRLAYGDVSESELVTAAFGMANRVAQHGGTREPQDIAAVVKRAYERLERRMTGGEAAGIPTVSSDLNRLLQWRLGELTIIQARPGIGKTSWALANLEYATRAGYRGLFFSLEMFGVDLVDRLASSWSGVDLQNIRNGELTDDQYARVLDVYDRLATLPIAIDDAPGLSAEGARGTIARHRAKYPDLALVVVDYVQRMRPSSDEKRMERYQQLGAISRTLKECALEYGLAILALAQTNRGADSRDEKRPRLSDLRESGDLEADADNVIGLYRDEVFNKNTDRPNIAELILLKQRNGPVGVVEMRFTRETGQWTDLQPLYDEDPAWWRATNGNGNGHHWADDL